MVSKHLISQVRRNENEGEEDNKRCVDVQVFGGGEKEMCEWECVKGKGSLEGIFKGCRRMIDCELKDEVVRNQCTHPSAKR